MSVTLRKIQEEDLEDIMHWRMAPDITKYMNTDPKLTLEGQKKWLSGIEADSDVKYWIILVDGASAGVINLTGLNRVDGELGWACYMGEKRRGSVPTAVAVEMSVS